MWTPQKTPCPRCHSGSSWFSGEPPGVQEQYMHQEELPAARSRLQPSPRENLSAQCQDRNWEWEGGGGMAEAGGSCSLQHTQHQGVHRRKDCYPQTHRKRGKVMPLPVSRHLPPNFGSIALKTNRKSSLRNAQLLVWNICMPCSRTPFMYRLEHFLLRMLFPDHLKSPSCLLPEPSLTHIPRCH